MSTYGLVQATSPSPKYYAMNTSRDINSPLRELAMQPSPTSGIITSLVVNVVTNLHAGDTIWTLVVNHVDTPFTFTVAAGDTTPVILYSSVPIVAGDLVALKIVTGDDGNTRFNASWAIESTPSAQPPSLRANADLVLGLLVFIIGLSVFYVRKPSSGRMEE
jgi:hypothetical protein